MDSETVHETARSGAGSVPDTGLLIWKSVDSGWRLLRRGVRPPELLPGRTGDDLPGYPATITSVVAVIQDGVPVAC
ncbi:Uncharacterised protein [Escherichia coli]|nr:Uncharacterised protein [Escherichia coli]